MQEIACSAPLQMGYIRLRHCSKYNNMYLATAVDDPILLETTIELLRVGGVAVRAARDGAEAVRMVGNGGALGSPPGRESAGPYRLLRTRFGALEICRRDRHLKWQMDEHPTIHTRTVA